MPPRFRVFKRFTFEAAHVLPYHDGKCARLHGHSWVGWLVVEGKDLHGEGPKQGMLVDFDELATLLRPLLADYLDHYHLNETTGLTSPTSEQLARWIFDRIVGRVPGSGSLIGVIIEETDTSRAEYWCY